MSDREDAIARVKALRAKASDAAATESEAAAAAMMAAKLLSKHDIDESELVDVKNTGATEGAANNTKMLPEVLHWCWHGIQQLTETKCYIWKKSQMRFIGTPYDVEMALYLSEMLVGASKRMWIEYATDKHLSFSKMMAMRNGFMHGFGERINQRLLELAKERQNERAAKVSHSHELVVVKSDLIKEWQEQNGLRLVKGRVHNPGRTDLNSHLSGFAAGDRVNLNRPVEDGKEQFTRIA